MIIVDHGFLRLCYHNFHKIDEKLYRSNMPTPLRIKKYESVYESYMKKDFGKDPSEIKEKKKDKKKK